MTNLALVNIEDLKVIMAESEIKNEVWNCEEAAKYLKVSKPTLTREATKGTVPGVKVGSDWRFSSIALYEHVSKNKK